jgi:hypothetical protein
MTPKTELEIQKAGAIKAARSQIRLKYSLMADAEAARVLPELSRRIDAALQEGKPLALDIPSILIQDVAEDAE